MMEEDYGRIGFADRASRASHGAASRLHHSATIPCAGADLREEPYHNGKAYAVLLAGERIGTVRHCFPTFERGPRQATWVTKRWKATKPYWEYLVADSYRPSIPYETRRRAVENLLRRVSDTLP